MGLFIRKQQMLTKAGFAILEVILAVGLISSLGLAIYRLQLAEAIATQQLLRQQFMSQAANTMANQIYADLNYSAANSLSRVALAYAESSYAEHTTLPRADCRNENTCSSSQYAALILAHWKQSLSQRAMGNIYALVCQDDSLTTPTISHANCSGQGGLVVKIVWQSNPYAPDALSSTQSSYVMLPVPQR